MGGRRTPSLALGLALGCGGPSADSGASDAGATSSSTAPADDASGADEGGTTRPGATTQGDPTDDAADADLDDGTATATAGTVSDDDAPPAEPGAIRFFGNGGLYDDRVLIELDDPATDVPGPAVDVGAEDFTIELWIRPEPDGNPNPAIACGPTNEWVQTNIIVDRDRHSQPPSFGVGIADGALVWAVQGEAGDPWSMCGTTNVLDGAWHHVAVQRRRSDGHLWLFVDGVLDAEVDGPDGDVSYPDDGVPQDVCPGGLCDYSDPFLAIGAEKHGYEGISYNGLVDELRISTTLRYAEGFAPPAAPFDPDPDTAGLYHFDDGRGTVATDDSAFESHGQLMVGGEPAGPQWVAASPWE